MANDASMIALSAGSDDPEDGDVTLEALEQALAEREACRRVRAPQVEPLRRQVPLRLNRNVVAKFRATGPGWQARIDAVLQAASV